MPSRVDAGVEQGNSHFTAGKSRWIGDEREPLGIFDVRDPYDEFGRSVTVTQPYAPLVLHGAQPNHAERFGRGLVACEPEDHDAVVSSMQLARTGRWVYGGAVKLVDIVAFPFDFWYEVGRAAGAPDHGETQVPLGPDGVLYYVRFTGAGDTELPTWVESSGSPTLEAAMAAAEERAPTPIIWNPPERSSGRAGLMVSR